METTMRNENSGISPKLREFGPIRVLDLMEVTRDGRTVVLSLESDTMAPERSTVGYLSVTRSTEIMPVDANLRTFKEALGFAYGELYKSGDHERGFIRARLHNGAFVVDGCIV